MLSGLLNKAFAFYVFIYLLSNIYLCISNNFFYEIEILFLTLHLTEVVEIEAVSNNQVTDNVPKI